MRPIDADYLINLLKLYPHGSVIGAIEQAPTIFNWIPVENDLPNHDEICLVSDKHNEVQTARFWTDGKINAWISTSAGLRVFVKAWMPLPDPYDEDMKKGKTMSDKQELRLKPCPFCGGEARIFVPGDGGICVKCTKCQCQTPYRDDIRPTNINYGFSLEEVIDIWNKRQNEERKDDETN